MFYGISDFDNTVLYSFLSIRIQNYMSNSIIINWSEINVGTSYGILFKILFEMLSTGL